MFRPEFLEWFEAFRLPPYHLHRQDGQYTLTFSGTWAEVMLWEVPALAVLMELYSRAVLRHMGRFELQVLYARALARLWEKVERLRARPGISIADFGTRRRHSFLWQDFAVQTLIEGLGPGFVGTSNCLIAMRREVEAIGTNAHELPMVYCALADTEAELAEAPYAVLAANTKATCASSCPTPMAPRASSTVRLTGWPRGPACASIPVISPKAPRPPSAGGSRAVRTRSPSWSSSRMRSTPMSSWRCMNASQAGCA
jgi:hypothetical protein